MSTHLINCPDCTEEFPSDQEHRCPPTTGNYTAAIQSFVTQSKWYAELKRKYDKVLEENAILTAMLQERYNEAPEQEKQGATE